MRTLAPVIRNAITDGLLVHRNCAECGNSFLPTKAANLNKALAQRFCSVPCRNRYTIKHHANNHPLKMCESCGEQYQPLASHQYWCSICCPNKSARMRLTRYGISQPMWDAMVARYDGKCWVCREAPAILVEHDHETGKVRGAACPLCNAGLHHVDKAGWWDKATAYLAEAASEQMPSVRHFDPRRPEPWETRESI